MMIQIYSTIQLYFMNHLEKITMQIDSQTPYIPILPLSHFTTDGLYPFQCILQQQIQLAQILIPNFSKEMIEFLTHTFQSTYPLVIVKDRGEFYAFYDECPHRKVPISEQGYLDTQRNFIVCGFHQWGFELKTGKHMIPTGNCIPSYPVEVSKNYIWIQLKKTEILF